MSNTLAQASQKDQHNIQRLIWMALLLIWVYRAVQGLLLNDLLGLPFVAVKADNAFWLYHLMGIPHLLHAYPSIAWLLDLAWLFLCLWKTYQPQANKLSYWMPLLICNYFILFNSKATHYEHLLVAALFMSFILIVRQQRLFILLWANLRYYVLFVMVSAWAWKAWRGSLWLEHQMSEILKLQHMELLINYPDAWYSQIISYLIAHPEWSCWLWYAGWLLEASFVIGFFTRRFDRILGICFLGFFLMDYVLMQLCFIEFCIFALVFYPFRALWTYYNSLGQTNQTAVIPPTD